MSIYLGQLGRLVELKCPADQQVTPDERYTFDKTAEGRVRAQVRPASGRRVWSLGTSDATTPQDQGAILSFVNGEWGPGPFVFVSADAPATNLLSPSVAASSDSQIGGNASSGGPILTADGWAGSSVAANGTENMFFGVTQPGAAVPGERVPAFPGQSVTGAAYLRGAGAFARLAFYNSADTLLTTANSEVSGTSGPAVRSWVTATAPAGAVSCRLVAVSCILAARPSITWTDEVLPWADGQGCPKAVLHGASRSQVMASLDPRGGRYSNISFTVTEVG